MTTFSKGDRVVLAVLQMNDDARNWLDSIGVYDNTVYTVSRMNKHDATVELVGIEKSYGPVSISANRFVLEPGTVRGLTVREDALFEAATIAYRNGDHITASDILRLASQ